MKKILGFLLFLIVVVGYSQKIPEKRHQRSKLLISDSIAVKLQKFTDSMMQKQRQSDSAEVSNSVKNNAGYFLRLQKEQKAKQKKAAFIRIGIGVALLVVLFIGLMGKRKK